MIADLIIQLVLKEDFESLQEVMPLLATLREIGKKAEIKAVGAIDDINSHGSNYRQQPALCCAAELGNIAIIRLLMQNGARIDSYPLTNTALHAAAKAGQLAAFTTLCQEAKNYNQNTNESINFQDLEEKTPLMLAAERGHTDIVKFICQEFKDVNFNKKDKSHRDAAVLAIANQHYQILFFLIENFKLDPDFYLLVATAYGDAQLVKSLMQEPIKEKPFRAASPAYRMTDKVSLIYLREKLPKIGKRFDVSDISTLHFAAFAGNPDVMKALCSGDNPLSADILDNECNIRVEKFCCSACTFTQQKRPLSIIMELEEKNYSMPEKIELLKPLLQAGAKPDLNYKHNNTRRNVPIPKEVAPLLTLAEKNYKTAPGKTEPKEVKSYLRELSTFSGKPIVATTSTEKLISILNDNIMCSDDKISDMLALIKAKNISLKTLPSKTLHQLFTFVLQHDSDEETEQKELNKNTLHMFDLIKRDGAFAVFATPDAKGQLPLQIALNKNNKLMARKLLEHMPYTQLHNPDGKLREFACESKEIKSILETAAKQADLIDYDIYIKMLKAKNGDKTRIKLYEDIMQKLQQGDFSTALIQQAIEKTHTGRLSNRNSSILQGILHKAAGNKDDNKLQLMYFDFLFYDEPATKASHSMSLQ